MQAGWCVRVSVFDDLVVSISERELAGRELSEADKDLIRDCARHLLSFVGEPESVDAVDPQAGSQQRPSTRDESSSGSLGRPPVPEAALRALIDQWRSEAAVEQRVSFCADELETLLRGGGTEET